MRILYLLILLFSCCMASCKKDNANPNEENKPHIPPVIEGKIYVANENSASVSVINAATNKVLKTIYLNTDHSHGLMPHNIQVSPDGKTVWLTVVTHSHDVEEEVVVLDAEKDSIIKRIPMSGDLHLAHIVLSSDGNFVYASATEANQVVEIDAKTYKVTRTFMLGNDFEPHGMRYFSGKLYIANMKHKSMSVIDLESGDIENIMLGGMAVQTAILPNGKYVFASLFDTKEIVRINIETKEIKRNKLPSDAQGPIQIYPTPDSKRLYICDQGVLLGRPVSNKVFVMDTESGEILHTISSALAPHGVVLSQGGEYAYVTNMMSDNVSVIETSTQRIITKIPVGSAPNGISFWSVNGGMP